MKKPRSASNNNLTPRERRQRSLSIQTARREDALLVLNSRRAYRISEPMNCDSCNASSNVVWRYAESNRGTVHICDRCKPKICVRSFGEKDAMNVAIQGGRFESDRRKH